MEDYMQQDPEVMSRVAAASGRQGNLVRYMNRFGPYPIYENTKVEYFPLGDDFFPALLRELKRAEKFIFMEFFIVEHGVMWDSILEVLEQKVKEDVYKRQVPRFVENRYGRQSGIEYEYVSDAEHIFENMKITDVEPVLELARRGIERNDSLTETDYDGVQVLEAGSAETADSTMNTCLLYTSRCV